jgi:hypothetical protein
MKSLPTHLLSNLVILLTLTCLTSCNKENPKPTGPHSSGGKVVAATNSQAGIARVARIAEWEKPYEWTQEQIKRHHTKLVLAELPEYIGEVWGCGGKDPESGILSNWAFVVPQEKIPDFLDYLRNLGVPEEYMKKDSPFRYSERENWIRPDPPVTKLRYLTTQTQVLDGVIRGLEFKGGSARVHAFENLNFSSSELRIRFDPLSGHACVEEYYVRR